MKLYRGTAIDIDDEGVLIVKDKNGNLNKIISGLKFPLEDLTVTFKGGNHFDIF